MRNTELTYSLVTLGNVETLMILFTDLSVEAVSRQHPSFGRIMSYLNAGGTDDAHVRGLLDAREFVSAGLRKLSDRITFDGSTITFDGDVVDNSLSRHLVRILREDDDPDLFGPVVKFMECLAQNPSPLSRRHLWVWLRDRDFTLTSEGHIVGYKAVQGTHDNRSITRGSNNVDVDGTIYTGHIPNPLGAVVSIARSVVDPNRAQGCSVGLHVGTWDYARQFGGHGSKILVVTVNPRDVVAVPRDCEDQKMRVCRYAVQEVKAKPLDVAVIAYPSHDDDRDHEDGRVFC